MKRFNKHTDRSWELCVWVSHTPAPSLKEQADLKLLWTYLNWQFFLQVAWIKADSKAILAIHDHVITNKRKIKVTRNDESTYVLTIEEVSQKDEGFYMCQVNSEPMLHQVKHI